MYTESIASLSLHMFYKYNKQSQTIRRIHIPFTNVKYWREPCSLSDEIRQTSFCCYICTYYNYIAWNIIPSIQNSSVGVSLQLSFNDIIRVSFIKYHPSPSCKISLVRRTLEKSTKLPDGFRKRQTATVSSVHIEVVL